MNKDIFEHMKNDKTLEKTNAQIKHQKKKVIQSLSPYKGYKMTDIAKINDQDIQNHLNNKE